MKRIRRQICALCAVLCVLCLLTMLVFSLSVNANGSRWLNRAQNTRIQEARKTTVQGTVYDSAMTPLAFSARAGERNYISDRATRLSLSHVIGDQKGMSETGAEIRFATTLLGMTDRTGTDKTLQSLMGDDPVGYDIVLTVNAELNKYVASLFPEGSRGACVIINYKTGEILSKVSLPAFDPAHMDEWAEDTAYYDRATQFRYAPGSVFKIVTLSAALDAIPGVLEEKFKCDGEWDFAGSVIRCAGGTAHGEMTLRDAFAKSCNITFASLAYRMGAARLKAEAEKFGFNTEFAFDDVILYASRCLNASDSEGELIQAGFGQGTTGVTPLHMAMISGAVANGGVMMEPKLVREVRRHSGLVISKVQPKAFITCLKPELARTVAYYMYETVRSGTGTRAKIDGYTEGYICGKTGSAETTSDKNSQTNAWYTGFLYEDENHPYAIAVVVEQGGAGGSVAAPIAAKALKKAIDLGL